MKKSLWFVVIYVIVLFAVVPWQAQCCTSWMIFSDLTGKNTHILHKNRDSISRKITVAISPDNAPRKWVALGNNGPNSGMNASGLAAVMNSGEVCIDPPDVKGKKTTEGIIRAVLESCDNAAQAVAALKKFIAEGNYSHGKSGSIFLFMDQKEGYICEITAKVCSVQRYESGYAVRASNWRNPDMIQYIRSDITRFFKASAREYSAFSGLNKIIDNNGKITLPEIFNLSRNFQMPKKSPLKRAVCGNTTNSAASFEIDKQYPDILSTAYFAVGHPRHTVYIPIPICVKSIPSIMKSRKWSATAFARLDKLKLESPLPEEWIKFENDSMALYAKAQAKARKMLAENKRDEAVKHLNFVTRKIWRDAAGILKIHQ